MKIALVTWIDSFLYSDQVNYDHQFDYATITSSGILLENDEKKVVITQDNMQDAFRSTLAIPKVAVTSFEIIYSDEETDDMPDTFFRTFVSHPYWIKWQKHQEQTAHEWDVSEAMEIGRLSREHYVAFLNFVQDEKQF